MELLRTKRGATVFMPDGKVLTDYFWDRSRFSCIQGPVGCLSAETEYLSPEGWKRMDAYDGGEVLCWSERGSAWFDTPEAYVDLPCDEMWWFHNEHALSMVLSDEHRVPLIDEDDQFCVFSAADIARLPDFSFQLPKSPICGGESFSRRNLTIERVRTTDGRKYCFTTPTGFFIARHNGRIFVTGNSGTSTASMMKMWAIALEQEPGHDGIRRTRWIVTRPTYKLLRETTLVTWDMWFPETAWGPRIRAEPGRHDLINVKNGGLRDHPSGDGTKVQCEVVFLAIESAEHAREILPSYEITGFFQNEGQFSEKDITTLLLSRCDRWPSPKYGARPTWSGGFMDMNAPMEGHWVPYMRGDLPLPTDMPDEEKVGYVKPDNWNFYVQPPGLIEHVENGEPRYEENPAAENAQWRSYTYLEKIQGWPRTDVDQLVLNKIGLQKHGKPVYPTFVESEHINPKDVQPDLDLPVIVGLDFGREPAAVFMQEKAGVWTAHSELIGQNESAERFAPRVKRHLAQFYPGARAEFWGDPRGADGTQATEVTAFDIFRKFGMTVLPATTDNSPELRRSTVEAALEKRGGLKVNPSCLVLKRGMAGGYHYRKIKGADGLHSPKPVKNGYSHVVEAMENALLGGGEGYSVVRGTQDRPKPVSRQRPRKRLRA